MMNTNNILTVEWLEKNNACKKHIDFAVKNKLIGFPFDKIKSIKGSSKFIELIKSNINVTRDYDSNNNLIYFNDSNGKESWKEYDEHGNVIHCKDSNGKEYYNVIEYYNDGQLKKFNDLEIPWFEK